LVAVRIANSPLAPDLLHSVPGNAVSAGLTYVTATILEEFLASVKLGGVRP